jgi:hypothetical protein
MLSTDTSNANHGLESDQYKNKFDSWTQVPSNRSKRSSKSHMQYPQPIPTIINCFAPLHNLNDETEVTQTQDLIDKIKIVRTIKNKNKVLMIGDSHARGYATEIVHNLGKTFNVSGTVMPGSRLETITQFDFRLPPRC